MLPNQSSRAYIILYTHAHKDIFIGKTGRKQAHIRTETPFAASTWLFIRRKRGQEDDMSLEMINFV